MSPRGHHDCDGVMEAIVKGLEACLQDINIGGYPSRQVTQWLTDAPPPVAFLVSLNLGNVRREHPFPRNDLGFGVSSD